MAYAILRFAKMKTQTQITNSFNHMTRSTATKSGKRKNYPSSADPKLKNHNQILRGTPSPINDFNKKLGVVENIQKNAVLGVEVLMTASPEWWAAASADEQQEWVTKSSRWLAKEFGSQNVVHLQMHNDERTPHLTGMIIPRIKKYQKTKGRMEVKLSAASWMDGKEKMIGLQDRYHDSVASLGLERGKRGSQDIHERPNEYLARVQQEQIDAHDMQRLSLGVAGRVKMMNSDFIKSVNDAMNEQEEMLTFAAKTVKAQKKKIEDLKKAGAKSSAELDEIKRENQRKTSLARELPLSQVADKLGLIKKREINDNIYYEDDATDFKIAITEERIFKDFKNAQDGGKGAIDLVKHVMKCDFQEARTWLIDNFGLEDGLTHSYNSQFNELVKQQQDIEKQKAEIVREVYSVEKAEKTRPKAAKIKSVFNPPPKGDEAAAEQGTKYLTEKRMLSVQTVKNVAEQGLLYFDKMKNAIFHHNTYCEKVGTGKTKFKGFAPGSNRMLNAWRWTPKNDDKRHSRLVITESPIDAMSYKELHGDYGTFAATGGSTFRVPDNLRNAAWQEVVLAFDNDKAGLEMAQKLKADLEAMKIRNIKIHTPAQKGADWNDTLKQRKEEAKRTQTTSAIASYAQQQPKRQQAEQPQEPPESPKPRRRGMRR